jgi:hypothetical protein
MLKVPREERLELFKFVYACSMFCETRKILEFMKSERIGGQHPLGFALWTAVHAVYGKPFKQEPKSIRIGTEMIEPEALEIHENLMTARDKIFAHADLGKLQLDDGTAINSVGLVARGRSIACNFRYMNPTERRLEHILSHVAGLESKCRYHSQKLLNKYTRRLDLRDGEMYLVNTSTGKDDLLVPWLQREGLDHFK